MFLTEGNCNFNSENIAFGTKKFILKHDLFDYKNNLLPNDKLTLHVEVFLCNIIFKINTLFFKIYLAYLLSQSIELLSLESKLNYMFLLKILKQNIKTVSQLNV